MKNSSCTEMELNKKSKQRPNWDDSEVSRLYSLFIRGIQFECHEFNQNVSSYSTLHLLNNRMKSNVMLNISSFFPFFPIVELSTTIRVIIYRTNIQVRTGR